MSGGSRRRADATLSASECERERSCLSQPGVLQTYTTHYAHIWTYNWASTDRFCGGGEERGRIGDRRDEEQPHHCFLLLLFSMARRFWCFLLLVLVRGLNY